MLEFHHKSSFWSLWVIEKVYHWEKWHSLIYPPHISHPVIFSATPLPLFCLLKMSNYDVKQKDISFIYMTASACNIISKEVEMIRNCSLTYVRTLQLRIDIQLTKFDGKVVESECYGSGNIAIVGAQIESWMCFFCCSP